MKVRSSSRRPVRKVTGASAGGAAATILVFLLSKLLHVEVDPATVGAFVTLGSFLGGYLTPPGFAEVKFVNPTEEKDG